MYHSILFNVIHQALEWHGFPVPTLRQLSYSERCEDFVWAEYLATWSIAQVINALHDIPFQPYDSLIPRFGAKLQECFCDDVQVRHVELSPRSTAVTCILYVQIFKTTASGVEWWDSSNA